MRMILLRLLLFLMPLIPGAAAAQQRHHDEGRAALLQQSRKFLDAYASGDRRTVLGMVDADQITVYGSDVAEVLHRSAEFALMLVNDQKLWGGSAKIGPMRDVSTVVRGDLGTVFFDAGFSVGTQPEVTVRFATVWRQTRKGWLLVQSSNCVPTSGQSALELLDRAAEK